jgi:hypothetical protein
MAAQTVEKTTIPPPSMPATDPGRVSGQVPIRPRQPTIPPGTLEELDEVYAARPAANFSPEQAIEAQIADLESWACANLRKQRFDVTRFWVLRGMGFLGAVAASAGGVFDRPQLAVVFGAFTALVIAVDAAWPTSLDRSALRRATRDLRELQNSLKLKWDKVRLAYPDPTSTKRIGHALVLLDAIQAKREEVGKYLGDPSPAVTKKLER